MLTLNSLITLHDPLKNPITSAWDLVSRVLSVVLPLASIIFVAMFVYAGFSYILSVGEAQKVKMAQAMMTNAVIGFVIIASAFVILKLVQNGLGI
jgi:hypothetical protein